MSPVAAGFTLCEAIPVGVGGRAGVSCEGCGCGAEDRAGDGDLGSGAPGGSRLAVASTHIGFLPLVRTCMWPGLRGLPVRPHPLFPIGVRYPRGEVRCGGPVVPGVTPAE